jgi:hypothetical protein
MGYISTANTTTLTAKLTPIGRKKLISTNNNLVVNFSLGDSDANYYSPLKLSSGQVPTNGGSIGPSNTVTNSVGQNISIKSMLLVNGTGATKKAVEPQSSDVVMVTTHIGITTATTSTFITQNAVSLQNLNTDPLTNLFYSFNLPIDANSKFKFTGTTNMLGGYLNTALSGLAQDNIVVIAIDNSKYGEVLDGKTLKIDIQTLLSAHTIYSTFENSGESLQVLDGYISDPALDTKFLGDNIALLFCDDIKKPNGDSNLSWGTGWNTSKPFSVNRKQPYNFVTDTNMNEYADEPVGIAYLDKGMIVLTHPTIVSSFNTASTATTVVFDSVSTSITQNVTCLANRGEFGKSTNPTFTNVDTPRITEVGLYDADGDLIAIAKFDRQLEKNVNEFLGFGVKITL